MVSFCLRYITFPKSDMFAPKKVLYFTLFPFGKPTVLYRQQIMLFNSDFDSDIARK